MVMSGGAECDADLSGPYPSIMLYVVQGRQVGHNLMVDVLWVPVEQSCVTVQTVLMVTLPASSRLFTCLDLDSFFRAHLKPYVCFLPIIILLGSQISQVFLLPSFTAAGISNLGK